MLLDRWEEDREGELEKRRGEGRDEHQLYESWRDNMGCAHGRWFGNEYGLIVLSLGIVICLAAG